MKGSDDSLLPACAGGMMPADNETLVIRWLGTANVEFSYRGQVILVDAFINRGPRNLPIGIELSQIHRVDAVFIGHGHYDHMSDAADIALTTGADVFAPPYAYEKLLSQGLSAGQVRLVTNGGVYSFKGFTVEAVLAQHGDFPPYVGKIYEASNLAMPVTKEMAEEEDSILLKGAWDAAINTGGTFAYLFTFDTGFRVIIRDSTGPITPSERILMERIGKTDIGLVAYQANTFARIQVPATLPIVKLYNPQTFIPIHHDALVPFALDMGVGPLFMAIRDEMPGTKSIFPLYLEPHCFRVRNDNDCVPTGADGK